MKTQLSQARMILAWIVLAFAIVLFGFSISFAQDKKKTENGTVHIKIQKDENGRKTKIDTTISADQLSALKEHLKELDIDFDADGDSWHWGSGSSSGNGVIRMKKHKMSKEDREQLDEEMNRLGEEMKDLDEQMKDLHIEMFGFNDGDKEHLDFNFDMPTPPPSGPSALSPPRTFYFYNHEEDDDSDQDCNHPKHFNFRFHSFDNMEIPDSLKDDDHLIIMGRKGEERPEFEKEITGKNGEKVFVFKRKLPADDLKAKTSTSLKITHVKVYPNPGDGKLTVSFLALSQGDVQVSITDSNGKEVYAENLKDFSGEFTKEVDLSSKGKGAYFLKIAQGDDSITKKIVVE